MALTIKEVEHVALLARLHLEEKEKIIFTEQMSTILEYAGRLNELNTEDVEPLDHILSIFNVFRDDVVVSSPPRDEILSNAPLVEDGQYKVPRII